MGYKRCASAPTGLEVDYQKQQVQKKYKHGSDYGIEGNSTNEHTGALTDRFQKHVENPKTL